MNHSFGIWAFALAACSTVGGGAGAAQAPATYYYEDGVRHPIVEVSGLVATTTADGAEAVKAALPGAEVFLSAGGTTIFKSSSAEVDQGLKRTARPTVQVSPVYREGTSAAGRLMTLPGGALVSFKPDWTEAQVKAWVAARGFALGQKMNLPGNWYLVATPPGAASLTAANAMQESGAVLSATPNWWKQASTK